MSDRYRHRPRSPPLQSPARSSLPVVGYYPTDRYGVPTRREVLPGPRSSGTFIETPITTETVYKVPKGDPPARRSSLRDNSRTRRSTLDSTLRPKIVMADRADEPRHPERPRHSTHTHGGSGRPESPLHNPYRSSDEGGEYYTMPASSERSRGHRRQAYSTTMDNADLNRLSRERDSGADRLLRIGSGREGTMYPGGSRSRQAYPGVMSRRKDSVGDDYNEDGYGYTNPKDLVQYDLNRSEPKYSSRRDSYDGPRPARPTNAAGYQDVMPRSYDAREKGPPPSTRGFDRIPTRAAAYDAAPSPRMPMPPGPGDINSRDPYYESEPPRRSDSRSGRRPVSVYHDNDRRRSTRDDDPRDDDLRYRREKPQSAPRYDEGLDSRGSGIRADPRDDSGFDKVKDHEKRKDFDRKDDFDNYDDRDRKGSRSAKLDDDYDDRDRKGTRASKLHDDHDDRDRKGSRSSKLDDDYEDRDRKGSRGGKLAAGLSLAGAALGINAVTKKSRDDDSSDSERDEPRRRRDGDEHRRRREPRDDRDIVDLAGRDPQERHAPKDEKDLADDTHEVKEKTAPKADKPEFIDLSGRNPQEKRPSRDERDPVGEIPERRERRKLQKKAPTDRTPESSDISPDDDEPNGHRTRRDRPPRENAPLFNPQDTMDLRALKDALNAKDTLALAPPTPTKEPLIKEPLREGSFERINPRDLEETPAREDRGRRRSDSEDDHDHRPPPRLVSPPRGEAAKKPDEKVPVKGILRQPREKFPEDPAPIREGVAPLKGAGKDLPPDKRWTKIDRRLVNPDALEAGKERYEARDDFVIVLRVLSKEEIQAYAVATQQLRDGTFKPPKSKADESAAARAEIEEREEREERRRRRRERHERHLTERHRRSERDRDGERDHDHEHRRHTHRERDEKRKEERASHSESDTTDDDTPPKMIEGGKRRVGFEGGGRDLARDVNLTTTRQLLESQNNLREDPVVPGVYSGYVRNPPRKERE